MLQFPFLAEATGPHSVQAARAESFALKSGMETEGAGSSAQTLTIWHTVWALQSDIAGCQRLLGHLWQRWVAATVPLEGFEGARAILT